MGQLKKLKIPLSDSCIQNQLTYEGVAEAENKMQRENSRIWWRSVILIGDYFDTGLYEKYWQPAGCSTSHTGHNEVCLSNS